MRYILIILAGILYIGLALTVVDLLDKINNKYISKALFFVFCFGILYYIAFKM